MTGNNFFDDLDEVRQSILESNVISIFFPYFRKTVLIDTRSNETIGPDMMLTDMVNSPQERIRSMEHLRPGLPELDKMILVPWVRYVDTLVDSGIWGAIIKRLEDCDLKSASDHGNQILNELKTLEKLELAAVVNGPEYQTLWSRKATR